MSLCKLEKRCSDDAGLEAAAGAVAPTCSQKHLEEGLCQRQFSMSSTTPLTATEQQILVLRLSWRRLTELCLLPPATLDWAGL